MSMKLNLRVGKYIESIKKSAIKTEKQLKRAVRTAAEKLMTDIKTHYVPVDQGILRSSGFVLGPIKKGTVFVLTMGFGGPAGKGNLGETNNEDVGYAVIIHENPRAGKTGGLSPSNKKYKTWSKVGGWKYLERPLKKWRPKITKAIVRAVDKGVG
ncbi:MAG: hypothetical protein KAJ19_08420 [Gammaproteobacteria bacterium]|nr:hypothetical protein [Gammaproteobacteria bacterium]